MSLLHDAWKDTLGIAREPLIKIGSTDLTLLRLLGLTLIIVIIWKITHLTRRAIFRLSTPTTDPAVYLLSRLASYFVWVIGILIGLNYLGFELSSFAFLGGAMGLGLGFGFGFGLQNILHMYRIRYPVILCSNVVYSMICHLHHRATKFFLKSSNKAMLTTWQNCLMLSQFERRAQVSWA